MLTNLAPPSYWDETYAEFQFPALNLAHPVAKLILKYFSDKAGRVFEAGCFPGNFLAVFGTLGYELNGLDTAARTVPDLVAYLKKQNFKVGHLIKGDFLNFSDERQYDLVCSFGFIEHFLNTEEIILKHEKLVAPDGYLMITTPNFRGGGQRLLHWLLDRENYDRHNIKSMDPTAWKKLLTDSGYEILYCGWFGGIDFWTENHTSNIIMKTILGINGKIFWILKKIIFINSRFYSPFCGLIAHKIT